MQAVRLKHWYGSTRLNPRNLLPMWKRQKQSPVQRCRQTSRLLILKIAIGLKKIINGDFERRVFIQEEAAQKRKTLSHGKASRMDDL